MRLHDEFCTVSFDFIDVFSDEFTAVPGYRVERRGGTADWLLFYSLGGLGTFLHTEGAEVVTAHDAVLVTPETPQRYAIAPGAKTWRFCWAHFHAREHWLGWLNWPAVGPGILRLHLDNLAQRRRLLCHFRELNGLSNRPDRSSLNFAMNRLEAVLLVLDEVNRKSGATGDQRVGDAIQFILQNLATPLSLQRIADVLAVSESRLWHLFTK
jgi:AraC family transcriptional regulator of arabinose operon